MAEIDLINSVLEHRLRQVDLDRILAVLSETDRAELLSKVGDLLARISALLEVSNRMQGTLSLDALLPRLMEIVTEAMNADRSSLFLVDPETNELFSRPLVAVAEIARDQLLQRFSSHVFYIVHTERRW